MIYSFSQGGLTGVAFDIILEKLPVLRSVLGRTRQYANDILHVAELAPNPAGTTTEMANELIKKLDVGDEALNSLRRPNLAGEISEDIANSVDDLAVDITKLDAHDIKEIVEGVLPSGNLTVLDSLSYEGDAIDLANAILVDIDKAVLSNRVHLPNVKYYTIEIKDTRFIKGWAEAKSQMSKGDYKGGTIAVVEIEIDGKYTRFATFSGDKMGVDPFKNLPNETKYIAKDVPKMKDGKSRVDIVDGKEIKIRRSADFDAERKAIEHIETILKEKKDATGVLVIYVDRQTCPSCFDVIADFAEEHHNITITVFEHISTPSIVDNSRMWDEITNGYGYKRKP